MRAPVVSLSNPPIRVYVAAVVTIFFLSLSAADSIGFVPNYVDEGVGGAEVALSELPQLGDIPLANAVIIAQPERLIIPAINKDLPLQNPATRDIKALEEILKVSPARYVDSAFLGESGNVLLFGHSSHLPVIKNQMYKAFNDIELLVAGDEIIVVGGGKEYLYRVSSVRMVDAKSEVIELSKESTRLTLVTCNTFGEKTSRWLVEAEFIGITGSSF
ncbi:MAG: hypothetical protein UY63_C0015G0016 [Parcubacteria group bacterium GW2011_GWA2_51_10]|nr:MAG: hypothetical protein UY63_C0015G0016 [Parcubacteria group bacterium GW2011_GWA2_51_10]